MPLARVIAPLPEYCERLAQDLRARGFDVETASPGQFFSSAADLEITVRQCAPEDAGKIAAASSKDMCVFLGASARSAGIRSIEMIVLQAKPEAAEPARHFVTPAQVIEISSALLTADQPSPQPQAVEKVKRWPKVKVATQSSWEDIARTTAHWMESASAGCQAAWEKTKQATVPAKAFFSEIGEETRKLAKNLSASMTGLLRRARRNGADLDEQLVPSMFDFSQELSSSPDLAAEQPSPVIEMPKRNAASANRRFRKTALAAGVAALLVFSAVSVMRRPHQAPAATSETPVAKAAAPATLKPSAMVEHSESKGTVHLASAKQVIRSAETPDTVVRYGNRPAKQKAADSHPGIKRYSDLD